MGTLFYIIGIACAVWVIYDVWAVNQRLSSTSKLIWTIFALLFNIVTAIVYFFVQKK